jgi:alkylhydroperoxidase family enzyme
LVQQGVTPELYEHVAQYRERDGYTEREKLAIEYAERFVLDHLAIDDDFFARLRAAFADVEVLDLTICISAFLAIGRVLQVLHIDERAQSAGTKTSPTLPQLGRSPTPRADERPN